MSRQETSSTPGPRADKPDCRLLTFSLLPARGRKSGGVNGKADRSTVTVSCVTVLQPFLYVPSPVCVPAPRTYLSRFT